MTVIIINDKQIPFLPNFAETFVEKETSLRWFSSRTNWGFLIPWTFQIFAIIMGIFSRRIILRNLNQISLTHYENPDQIIKHVNKLHEKAAFVNLVYMINILAILYFPLYLLASPFNRLLRNLMILNYLAFAITNSFIRDSNLRIVFNFLVVLFVIIFSYFSLFSEYRELIIENILKHNIVFGN